MRRLTFVFPILLTALLAMGWQSARAAGNPLLLLRSPTMSKTTIAFEYGGELWTVPRAGGQAHVMATGLHYIGGFPSPPAPGTGSRPIFSPNGKWIAFTGTFDHNTDVYVVPTDGGQPVRLTWHPGADVAVGWTPNSKRVLFRSRRHSFSLPYQLYTVPITGGFPRELPLPTAGAGSYSPTAARIAYVPNFQWEPFWQGYKGGQHTKIWIARLSDSHTIRIPDHNADANDPMWVGHTVYFLSNRDGPTTLFAYDVDTGSVTKLINNTGSDITSASAGPGGIVYSQFGQLHVYDFATGKTHAVHVTVHGPLPQRRPHYQNVAKKLSHPGISPNGVRAVFQANGDILTVPAKHGSVVNLTHSPGAMDRDPAWSPNGKFIAYFSDRDGEYDLYIRPQAGGSARKVALGQKNAFYYDLAWSPDSEKLVFRDQKNDLWLVNPETPKAHAIKIATSGFIVNFGNTNFEATWSPDSLWVTYTKALRNHMHGIFIYSLGTGQTHQITHGSSNCKSPVFSANGKYLYFLASTDSGPSMGTDMATLAHPVTYHVYAVTLRAGSTPPVAVQAGFDEDGSSESNTASSKSGTIQNEQMGKSAEVKINFAGITARITSLPIKPANYRRVVAGTSGTLYLTKAPLAMLKTLMGPRPRGPAVDIERFTLKNKKTENVVTDVTHAVFAADGKHMLYKKHDHWFIADTKPKAKPTRLKIKNLRVYVVPHKQWDQMYRDAWRIEHAFFYSPIFDGLNVNAAEKEFAHYLPGIASRNGLTFLFREMMSYMSVGHMFISGGHVPKMQNVKVGLLGANYKVNHGHYQITRIFTAGKWNPELYAPLAQPGLNVKSGDYILAVNGHPIDASTNIYKAFVNLAGKTVILTVGPNPSIQYSHEITVKTISSERKLRHVAWIRHNMEVVSKLSHGKLAYIYLPNTAWGGFTNFNRYFFSQVGKQGVVIDERFNTGGDLSDYIIRYLTRKPMALLVRRWNKHTPLAPTEIIRGPKVMIINEMSGSGGDALPWYFKMDKVGTLVGVRTWGGLVGIGGYPPLMDSGRITAPRIAVEGLNGTFPVENHGITPNVTVWQNPQLVRQGHDPQLDAAVKIAMKQLQANPLEEYSRPPWRNYHEKLPPLPVQGTDTSTKGTTP